MVKKVHIQTRARIKRPSKICIQCNATNSNRWYKGPVCSRCYLKQYRQDNHEKLLRQIQEWYKNNKERNGKQKAIYRKKHSKKIANDKQRWNTKNRDKLNKKFRLRYQQDLHFKLICVLRSRLNIAIKQYNKSGHAINLLGCSIIELKTYLESLFLPKMSWSNWGMNGWHIDHIIPLSSFDLSDPEQLKKACHYTNLQPLWALDNIRKSNKIT